MSTTQMQPLRFGLSLPNRAVLFGLPPQVLLETAEQADAAELISSLWVGDNFLSKPRLEVLVTLSALAARTRRLTLGTVCLASFPLRHPLLLAIQWASLDVLSGGRTMLVVCNGGSAKSGGAYATELAASGVRSADRVARLEEGIELLRLLFGPEPVTFHGRFYDFENVQALPKPVQSPVPIGIAVNPAADVEPELEERILRRVARLADCWQTDNVEPSVNGWSTSMVFPFIFSLRPVNSAALERQSFVPDTGQNCQTSQPTYATLRKHKHVCLKP